MACSATVPSPLGMLTIAVSEDGFLCEIELLHQGYKMDLGISTHGSDGDPPVLGYCKSSEEMVPDARGENSGGNSGIANVIDQLQCYFLDPGWRFDLPLAPSGTPFKQRVWQALQSIPPGETKNYGRLATQLCTSARAVGNACRENPIPIVIPCHRVVGAHGLGGYMGSWDGEPVAIKQWLLTHESSITAEKQDDIPRYP